MTVAGLASLAVTWWSGPIDQAVGGGGSDASDPFFPRIDPMVFSARGVVPIGYAALAFALDVLLRRTLPAMATTLAVFTAVQIAMPLWVRPHLGEVRDLRRQRRRQRGVLRCQRRWDLRANKAPRIAVAVFSVRLAFTGSVAVSLSASVS